MDTNMHLNIRLKDMFWKFTYKMHRVLSWYFF